jgi:protein-tyrosine phosphatase
MQQRDFGLSLRLAFERRLRVRSQRRDDDGERQGGSGDERADAEPRPACSANTRYRDHNSGYRQPAAVLEAGVADGPSRERNEYLKHPTGRAERLRAFPGSDRNSDGANEPLQKRVRTEDGRRLSHHSRAGVASSPGLPGTIDLHSHVLPGLDDGAASLKESLALARALAASGVRVLAATPHVSARYPTTWSQIEKGLKSLRLALDARSVAVEIVQGAEVALEQLDGLDDDTLHAFTLGGTGKFLLLEFPYEGWPPALAERIEDLAAKGIGAVLAHPERNPLVQSAPQRLAGLLEAGALVQVNAGSLTHAFGAASAAAARHLVDNNLAHLIASDSHRPLSRPTLAAAVGVLPEPLARWLTWDAPEAILAGERPPPPPPRAARRRRWFLR